MRSAATHTHTCTRNNLSDLPPLLPARMCTRVRCARALSLKDLSLLFSISLSLSRREINRERKRERKRENTMTRCREREGPRAGTWLSMCSTEPCTACAALPLTGGRGGRVNREERRERRTTRTRTGQTTRPPINPYVDHFLHLPCTVAGVPSPRRPG